MSVVRYTANKKIYARRVTTIRPTLIYLETSAVISLVHDDNIPLGLGYTYTRHL